jgi:lysophospholipase L1-like esterase
MSVLSPKRRIAFLFVCVCLAASGCSKLGIGEDSPTAPSGPPSSGSTIVYSAVGASDVIGFGSTKPCLPFDDCNGNGYVWVAARALRAQGYTVNVVNRGYPGAVVSRAFQDLGNQYGRQVPGNLIDSSGPFVDQQSTLVSVFAGVNDVMTITSALGGGAGGSNPAAYIDGKADAFVADYQNLLSIIRRRAPGARLIILNVPNVGGIPALAGASLSQRQAAQRAAVRMTSSLNALRDATVVDLMCDARLYTPSVFSSDGLHPNDAGYALLGDAVARAVTTAPYPAPRASCPQMTLF